VGQAEVSAARDDSLPAGDCRLQLDRILKSADFEATARERRFLSHVVEESLAGRGDRIKAYSIAVEVFGRDASFDPQTDPIVRIEAGHLRRSLERYYLTAGQSDAIVITIPKGAYVPTFALRSLPTAIEAVPLIAVTPRRDAAASWRQASWATVALAALVAALAVLGFQLLMGHTGSKAPEIPRLLVEKFDDLSRTDAAADLASGLTQEVISHLSKFRDIVVVESTDPAQGKTTVTSRYALSGSVDLSPEAFRLRVRLINQSDGSVLWANSYDGDMKVAQLVRAQNDIAENVATSLAQTYGVIFQADAKLNPVNPPDDWSAYSCTLSYYAYRASLDQTALPAVRACLEKAVERFPTYATAWALLAQTYVEDVRFRVPFDPVSGSAAIDLALATARHSVELDPLNIRGLQAEMFALYFSHEFDEARSVGERALAINPNDTELMGEFGYRLALSGDWDAGCPLVAKARERNPGQLAYYESALALCSYFAGDQKQAVIWIERATVPKNPIYHFIAAAIYGEATDSAGAERERSWLMRNAPGLVKNARQELAFRFGRPRDAEFFMRSLAKAGLDVGV
jgi:TolB-like protein/Tfp pilus assembly protein PilF